MTYAAYNIQPWLTAANLAATSNQSGTYLNGLLNNGVGATFTYATGVLTVDGVVVVLGDRVLLQAQTSANQNGLYVCTQAGAVGVAAILTRSTDYQCIEQVKSGFYVSIKNGVSNAGALFVTVDPTPARLGIDNLLFVASSQTNNSAFTRVLTLTAAQLASAAKVVIQAAASATCKYLISDIKVLKSTGLSGGGGDRLLTVADGTTVFNNAGITAALLGTPILTLWGGSGNPIGVGTTDLSAAGASVYFNYSGGTTDYTTGSVMVAVTLVPVAL